MSENIVIIGANEFQLPLVLRAKQMGLTTHVFAWREGAVAAEAADRFYPISIVETEEILKECRRISPKAVATIGSDLAAITVNKLANALGLPSNPPVTAHIATNKYAMRGALLKAGVPTPAFVSLAAGEDTSAVRRMRLPVIVKPTDRSDSRGITKLESLDGLDAAIALAAGQSFEKRAIVEEFAAGHEYSCECVSQYGVHHMLALTKKFTTGAPHYIETGHIQPAGLSEDERERVRSAVFAALDALQVTTGASHTEFKLLPDTGEVFIIEVGARMGGDCIGSDLVRISTGHDFLKLTLQAALGEPIDLSVPADFVPRTAAIRFIFNRADLARLNAIKADSEAASHIVRVSDIAMGEDDMITDSGSRFGFYILSCGDERSARELAGLNEDIE